jgi:hypothetical protein
MKMHLLKNSLILLSLLAFANLSMAATIVWKGTTSSAWNNASNWTGGIPGAGDDVTIGVTAYTGVDPVVTASTTVKSITFGPNNAGNTAKPISLTVNGAGVVLTVSTTITQNYSAGTAGSSHSTSYGTYTTSLLGTGTIICTGNFVVGNTTVAPANYAANIFIISSQITQLTIGGDLLMNAVGNNSSSAQNYPAFNLDNNKMTLCGQFNFTTTGNPASGTYAGTNSNYIGIAIFCANNNTNTNVTTLELQNNTPIKSFVTGCCVDFDNKGTARSITIYDAPSGSQRVYTDDDYPYTGSVPDTYVNLVLSGNSTKVFDGDVANIGANLTISGGPVDWATNDPDINVTGNVLNSSALTEGSGTVTVNGNWQNNSGSAVNGNNASATTTIKGTLINSGTITCNSENISVTGAATNNSIITGGAGTLTFNSTFANTSGSSITTGAGTATFKDDYTNTAGSFTAGSGKVIFDGDYTVNAGSTFTAGSGTVYFSGSSSQALIDKSTNGTVFNNVTFNGNATATMSAGTGNFGVSPSGILTMTSPAKLVAGSSSAAYLTLNSDATGSAIVAAITGSSSITGYVNVERFMKGSNSGTTHDLTQRGYRLLSSTVYTGTDALSSHVSDFQYLVNSVYVSGCGMTTNGFNVTTTSNPSIYLFREDDMPPPSNTTLFTTGYNWKGVAKINNTPAYNFGIQAKNTTSNINDATYTLPVGNGFLFFFRGSNVAGGNGSTAGTQLTAPFNYPDDVVLTQTGNLNTGSISVRLWYSADYSIGNNFTVTAATTPGATGSTSVLTSGFTLVGNPYPSTINWEKYNNTHASGAITGGGTTVKLPSTIWVFNVVSKQYESYIPAQGSDVTSERPSGSSHTGSSSNMIASGQGFFVKATVAGQNLTFTEAAKVSTQPSAANLLNLMGRPKELASAPLASFSLKLTKDSINTDDIVINLNNGASTKFADGEDAEDLGGSGALVSLGSFTSDSVQVAINALPFPGVKPQSIRLLVDATGSGTYQLTSPQLSSLPKLYSVWLKDAFTNDSLKLQANSSYSFTIDKGNPATFGNSRFTLVIRQDTVNAYRLLSFTAAKANNNNNVVQLVWKTVNEQNYTNFTVERSTDGGKNFTVVGGLQGTGAGLYSLLDNSPVQGQNLYRLKQEDLNNNITYSYVVSVQYSSILSNAGNIHVYPNPAIHTINLDVVAKTDAKASYDIVVTNSSGVAVKQATSAQTSWQSGISNLMPGTYLVRVINNNDKTLVGQSKFVKL